MASLSSLNSYSAEDVVLTVDTQFISANEGANIEMPLMAWTPIHDIGDPFTGNGVAITHSFDEAVYNMNNGLVYTQSEYDDWLAEGLTYPSIYYGSTEQLGSNVVTKNNAYSLAMGVPTSSYSITSEAPTVNIGYGNWCIEGWFYNSEAAATSNYLYDFRPFQIYYNRVGTQEDLWLVRSVDGSPNYYWRINLTSASKNMYLNWRYIAVQRRVTNGDPYAADLIVFVDGVKAQTDYYGTSTTTLVTSNAAISDTQYYGARIIMGQKDNLPPGNNFIGYIDQLRLSNNKRYETTDSFTPPTTPLTVDEYTLTLLEFKNGALSQNAPTPYPVNNPLVFPNIVLARLGDNPNVVLTQASANVWNITGIHTPEDYLAAGAFLDFPRDYYGSGNSNAVGTGSWVTNIRNQDVGTYDFTYPVNLELENKSEISPTALGDVVYNFYGNTTADYANIQTVFNSLQYTQITDNENPDTETYTVTIDTQHHPWEIQLSSNVSNANPRMQYYGNSPGANGQFVVSGTKSNVNLALQNIVLTKNDYVTTTSTDRPNYRNMVGRLVTNNSTGEYYNTSGILTGQTTSAPGRIGYYCQIPNETFTSTGRSRSLNYLLPNTGSTMVKDSTWSSVTWDSGVIKTHEFWIMATDASKNCVIHTSNICLSIYNNKLWMAWDSKIPGQAGQSTADSNQPRRIEHNNSIASGTWYHIAMINDSGTFKFYVNGVDDSTVYTSGTTTTATANAASGFTLSSSSLWHYGGPPAPVLGVSGTYYNMPGFDGYIAQIRLSSTIRYTEDFDVPEYLFINDPNTLYLHQFNATLATDDYALPTVSTASKVFTWTVKNPLGNVIGSTTQNYYPVLRNPVFTEGDINFTPESGKQARIGYAGRTADNNPIWMFPFKSDTGNIVMKVNQVDVATGNVIIGPTHDFGVSSPGSTYLYKALSQFDSGGYAQTDNGNTANVWITDLYSSAAYNTQTGVFNQDYEDATITGEAQVFIGNTTSSTTSSGSASIEYASALAYRGSNVVYAVVNAVNVDGNSVQRNNGNAITTLANANFIDNINILGFSNASYATTLRFGTAYRTSPVKPTASYQIDCVNSAGTQYSYTNDISGSWGSNSPNGYQGRIKGCNRSTALSYAMLGLRVYPYTTLDPNGDYQYLCYNFGNITASTTPRLSSTVEAYVLPRPGQSEFNHRIGAYAVVSGSTSSRVWMLYTIDQEVSGGSTTFGPTSNTSKGLYYRSIDITSSSITWGTPVQVTDPAEGAIYGTDMTASSQTIGSYTYIYAILASSSSTQPYTVSLRIPN